MKTKAQYFRWYPAEAEADEDWRLMDESRIGLFVVLLNYGWCNDGLPASASEIWRAIPLKIDVARFQELWSGLVEKKFPLCADGRRRNTRQEKERLLANDVSEKRAEAARKGRANAAANAAANAEQLLRESREQTPLYCNLNSSLSSSSVSSSERSAEGNQDFAASRADAPKPYFATPQKLQTDDSWEIFEEAAAKADMGMSDEERISLCSITWPRLSFEQRLCAVDAINRRHASGEYANGYTPGARRYLEKKLWTAPDRKRPQPRKSVSSEAADRVTAMIEREEYEAEQKRRKSAN